MLTPVFASEPPTWDGRPSIFLAGPTPRNADVESWRPTALTLLSELVFDGLVLVPERREGTAQVDYIDQVEWEYDGLEAATVIAFWVPRDLATLPGFTTNVEFGRYVGSGRAVYGRPAAAPKNSYLDWLYTKLTARAPLTTLEATMCAAVAMAQPR